MSSIIFIEKNGKETTIEAENGLSIMEIAVKNGIDMEGSCGGCLACATCHVVVDPAWINKLKAKSDSEEDMLDMAFDLKATSRLSCQILMSDELDGIRLALPGAPTPWK